jgi:hypothetical protein
MIADVADENPGTTHFRSEGKLKYFPYDGVNPRESAIICADLR